MELLGLKEWLLGAIAFETLLAGLFFVHFWKMTRDRLFVFLSFAFFIEVVSQLSMALSPVSSDEDPSI